MLEVDDAAPVPAPPPGASPPSAAVSGPAPASRKAGPGAAAAVAPVVPRTPLDPWPPCDPTLRYVVVAHEPCRMSKHFETLATSIEEAQGLADAMCLHADAHERALGYLLTQHVLPAALREQKALERRSRQKTQLVDKLSAYYATADVGEGMYGRRSTRRTTVSYNVDAVYDSLGVR